MLNDAGQGVGELETNTTAFPAPIAQSSSWDPALQWRFGAALGWQAWHKGINVQLAPGVEIDRVPLNGRNFEYMSEDPYLAAQGAVAEVRGIQSNPVIATVKHYVANSQETNRMTVSSDVDQRTLEEIYTAPYEAAVKQGHAGSVMCSYNRINGTYACENRDTLTTILKRQFGFTGFVMSDWGGTHSTVAAANAGLDMEMDVKPGQYFTAPLKTAVQDGQVPMSRLNDMVTRIVAHDVLDRDLRPSGRGRAGRRSGQRAAPAGHRAGAEPLRERNRAAQEPGPAASAHRQRKADSRDRTGRRSCRSRAVLQRRRQRAHPGVRRQVRRGHPAAGHHAARAGRRRRRDLRGRQRRPRPRASSAKAADVAIVFAGSEDSEGVDRSTLDLSSGNCSLVGCTPQPVDQDSLISQVAAANPHTIVVLNTGGPVLMPWLNQIQGLFEAWYPGQQDGNAIAALLFGDVDPSAKLPETFPASQGDLPTRTPQQYPGVNDAAGIPHATYSEGMLVGYRWYDAKHITPLFPFGFGLTYTTFALRNLHLSAGHGRPALATATFTVADTGPRLGAEVAQLYVADPRNAGEPPKQLKGFQKVLLRPGARTTVKLRIDFRSLAHWSDSAHRWKVGSGCYRVLVGDSSSNLPLSATIAVGGARCKGAKVHVTDATLRRAARGHST